MGSHGPAVGTASGLGGLMASERAIQDDETTDIGVQIQNGRIEPVADCATVAATLTVRGSGGRGIV